MSKREDALNRVRYYGYHGNYASAARVYFENRLSLESFRAAYASGQRAKENGVPCNCAECKSNGMED